MKINSKGSARVWVGILLGVVFSGGILALTATWRPPEEAKTPPEIATEGGPAPSDGDGLPPEDDFPGEDGLSQNSENTEAGRDSGALPMNGESPTQAEETQPLPVSVTEESAQSPPEESSPGTPTESGSPAGKVPDKTEGPPPGSPEKPSGEIDAESEVPPGGATP